MKDMFFLCNEKNLFQKITNIMFAIITGSLGILSFSPYKLWFTSIISIFGLLSSTLKNSPLQSSLFGFIWGIGFFGTGINWISVSIKKFSNLSIFTNITLIIFLVIYLSLYPTIFSYFLTYFWPYNYKYRLTLGAPALWIIIECIRGFVFTGFPWLEFGYSQTDTILNNIAPIYGVKGITFLIVMISGTIVYSVFKKKIIYVILACFLFFFPFFLNRISWYKINKNKNVNIALIQGNIPPSKEYIIQNQESFNTYLQYTIPLIGKVKIIIWPESVFIKKEVEKNVFLKNLNKKLYESKTILITGIINVNNKCDYYNSIIILGKSVSFIENSNGQYDKHHLVPFGEIFPKNKFFKTIIQFLNLQLSSLNNGPYIQKQLEVFGIKITPSICYEAAFGEQIRDNFSNDTDFLLTIANNVWFGNSIGPHQFFQMVRMRSLELGRPLLYCSNSGMTSIIYPNGKVEKKLSQFTHGVLKSCVTSTTGKTLYSKYGSYPIFIISIFFILFGLITEYFYFLKNF